MGCGAGMGTTQTRPRQQPPAGTCTRGSEYYDRGARQWKGAEYNAVLELVSPLLPYIRYPLMSQAYFDDVILPTGLLAADLRLVLVARCCEYCLNLAGGDGDYGQGTAFQRAQPHARQSTVLPR